MPIKIMGVNFRILEIHIFYNCGLFYWHLIEILWLFIFLVFYYSKNHRFLQGISTNLPL